MIENSFSILDGIGQKGEKRLWSRGIHTWQDFINERSIPFLNDTHKGALDGKLARFTQSLRDGNQEEFNKSLKRKEHWRLFERFKDEALYLDIETNGLPSKGGGYVTMVGLYDGFEYSCLIRGNNLNRENLINALKPYKMLITFYGSVFDIPFLINNFALELDMLHFDVCLEGKRVGFNGGLKKIESILGILRDDDVVGMDGFAAVRLWQMYKRGDNDSLSTLIKYNREDTVNLLTISKLVYNELKRSTGIYDYITESAAGG
ncbi:MAG: ribonuclease H-like domain-containing protein [Nitrospirae bacterium]|nr:ribonuclease H-like domain-containing protein [Nitrospirota bacterium]MBF0533747.1 ribonuclease H-like domain-containing protein [Nitrospirota bacterium]MBF0615544.1 ribonuclease H-like domain-containing protein [Nitrospirota bacterium]